MSPSIESELRQAMQAHQSGRLGEAERLYRAALAGAPEHPMALHYLGLAIHQQGRGAEGVEFIRKSVAVASGQAVFHLNFAQVLHSLGRREEAVAHWRQAIALQPNLAQAHAQLGTCLKELGQSAEAVACLRRGLSLDPSRPPWHNELGNCLLDVNSSEQAAAAFGRAIELRPDFMEAWNNLGTALRELGRLGEAEAALRRAAQLAPDHAAVHSNLGHCLQSQGRIAESLVELRTAGRLDPNWAQVQSNLLMSLHYDPDLSPGEIADEHRKWAARDANIFTASAPPFRNAADPKRRLKVGYVSHNFTRHSVAYFIEPIIASHDPRVVEVTCYADVSNPDETTARFRQAAHRWRSIAAMSDEAAAQLIRADEIDILIDLAGHSSGRLLRVFARKPAPIQVTYLGYPDTTGMAAMDYRFTDETADPQGVTDAWHSERLVRLPHTAWCYRGSTELAEVPPADAPQVSPAPSETNGFITFGSFNNLQKLNPKVLDLWAAVLLAVPRSRLVLKAHSFADAGTRDRVLANFDRARIDRTRIDLLSKTPSSVDHLRDYGRIDVGLDPFPYNGTATTCEALWMGVPVITLAGAAHVSRVGASLMSAIGLPAFIAPNAEQYVRIAAAIASDPNQLAGIRAGMRRRIGGSPLRDEAGITRAIEAAYRRMWRGWCAGRAAANP